VEEALTSAGVEDPRVVGVEPVSGGCIHTALRIHLAGGSAFLKWSPRVRRDLFRREAEGLEALRVVSEGGPLRVPRVLGVGNGEGEEEGPGWLLLEDLPEAPPGPGYARRLGRGLARLHQTPVEGGWGWGSDNFLATLSQENRPGEGWGPFWRDRRLLPRLRDARDAGHFAGASAGRWDRLLARVDGLVDGAEEDGPSLLHGDLWSGNVFAGPGGAPVLVDPAVYRGHREVDLAMMELFGGFSADTFAAYREETPLQPGYREVRRDLYQLYPLLAHVNLFGGGYVAGAEACCRRLLAV